MDDYDYYRRRISISPLVYVECKDDSVSKYIYIGR